MMGTGTKIALLASMLSVVMVSAHAEVFRWTDKDGKVHYSDNPPADIKAEQRKMKDNSVDVTGPGFETTRAAQAAPVSLYTAAECKDVCDKARKLLSERKIPFKENAISTPEGKDALGKLVGKKEPLVPSLQVGGKTLEGFEAGAWNGVLDVAGYPKAPS
ncbi:DUF4124 domain-containing protein [Uliginosibacterium sp. H3]|uniref:DUF4124 domain-containing protein n=1 Tax=Uliginosibacterium silvisoli TaxID=3114758 RepID=A0ABU6K1E0_9RHOO|nr:DUF4124 domain-containing protein [Uliginosibacterium sp. H3]